MRNSFTDETSLLPSLLDRLLDDDPGVQREPAWKQAAVVSTIRTSVCRDLQCLLNARRMLSPAVERYPELADSLVNYGLPDLQSYEVRGDQNQAGLCRMIQDTIRRFEPRLQQVRVALADPGRKRTGRRTGERAVAFEIEAVLVVDPIEEPVVFTSTLDISRSEFDVEATR
jgi:type VI secretion system protein ImpF